jgi:hypothetical protein
MTEQSISDRVGDIELDLKEYATAFALMSAASDGAWGARLALSHLLSAGEPVKTAYEAAVKATKACDRALARLPKKSVEMARSRS